MTVGVPTLLALAHNVSVSDCLIAPIMDARRSQVYNALYRSENGILREVCPPRAVSVEDLCGGLNEKTLFVGDGVNPYREKITELLGGNALFAPPNLCLQSAASVALAARDIPPVSAAELGAAEIAVVSRSGELNYQNLSDRFGCRSFFLINTTPVGMSPGCNATPLDLREFPQCLGVADVVYNPLRTRLCQQAAALGIPACGGLLMLAAQAAAAEYAFGAAVPKPETVLRICGELRREQENLVLIGMPGSGKTTVGQRAARLMDREFIDCDERYLAEYGILPEEELLQNGEPYFRQRETALLQKLSLQNGCVIAAGGGAVLRAENVSLLRQNGRLCLLQRPTALLAREGRPLSRDLPELYRQRLPLYLAAADFTVMNDGLPQDTAARLVREFALI